MREKPRCDTCLNRVDECGCGQEYKIVRVSIGSCSESMEEWGEELGLKDYALRHFIYALMEVYFTLRVELKTGEYTILKVEE